MICYEDAIDYIENKRNTTWALFDFIGVQYGSTVRLLDFQKEFLKNLIDGKITNCPRGMGKTFVIKLYAEYLNYVTDVCKYDTFDVTADAYVNSDDTIESGLLSADCMKQALQADKEKAIDEYNISEKMLNKLSPCKILEKGASNYWQKKEILKLMNPLKMLIKYMSINA